MPTAQLQRERLETLIDRVISGMQRLEVTIEEDTPASIISMDKWDWSQGVGLFSLYHYYKESGNPGILRYLTDWFDSRLREGLPPKNVNTMCPLLTLSYLYEETRRPDYLAVCEEWASYAADEMPRTPEFGITHVTLDSANEGELRGDTLYMTVLFLGRMGVLLKREPYVQESVRQFLIHLKYLTDTRTGLFFHGWSFVRRDNFARALWGRGNAWYTAGLVDYLDIVELPLGTEMFLIATLEQQVRRLRELQTESGMWRTLLDDPGAYEETSATAGFAYGILKAVRMGYISEAYRDAGLAALRAVIRRIDADGMVQGVSYGTRMGHSRQFYRDIPQCPMPYGQSMTLLMLVESLHHLDD
ncbi:glycoside hydrolase family 88 protein [Paenibacillus sp. MWE-103]|uniref:Glycoside hydrolase family 88 protein n=1 Tax=Paenibacillus artemisiicola TaxID=1172618 RepID=A0ABS3WE60_9BACL|nr:glycoside hydrolase family 88 protein [Paenibacillus artemisiicola]MBO7746410.1 glycoside hydrolase family 88 protein [Paenibacillus artemisiicola]